MTSGDDVFPVVVVDLFDLAGGRIGDGEIRGGAIACPRKRDGANECANFHRPSGAVARGGGDPVADATG